MHFSSLVASPLLDHIGVLIPVPNDNPAPFRPGFPSLRPVFIQQRADTARASRPVIALYRVFHLLLEIFLLLFHPLDHHPLLPSHQLILPQDQIIRVAAALRQRDRELSASQTGLATRVLEISHFAFGVQVHRHFYQGVRPAIRTELLLNVQVQLLARPAQQFEPLHTRDQFAVQRQQFEPHLDYHVLHREI